MTLIVNIIKLADIRDEKVLGLLVDMSFHQQSCVTMSAGCLVYATSLMTSSSFDSKYCKNSRYEG
jgi:hypothetical protein